MTEISSQRIRISKEFFCDGHCYLLTSQSLGVSGLKPEELSEIMFSDDEKKIKNLLEQGVCFPVCFEGDCALDGGTLFVIGDLNEQEEKDWIAKLAWKLNIPCGKLILCCGCCEDELVPAVAGEPPQKHYEIYEFIDVPPDEYLVEIYAYFSSMTVQVNFDDYDEGEYSPEYTAKLKKDERFLDAKTKYEWHKANHSGIGDVDYIIRLKPLESEPPMPKLSQGWFEEFEFRDVELKP